MTTARNTQISIVDTPYYHCMARCVRRAFLCGEDSFSGQSYEHRKQWIVDRILQLSAIFAIDVSAYAVMSNHYHVVLYIDRDTARDWSLKEVAERWKQLFKMPVLVDRYLHNEPMSTAERDKVSEIIEQWRERLQDISWYMRCLNEHIARLANAEDQCKGRFWEGRFKSQALLDDTALLACMAYVDLNPVRAALSESLQDSDYTSIQERIRICANKLEKDRKPTSTQKAKAPTAATHPTTPDEIKQPAQLLPFIGPASQQNDTKKGMLMKPQDYFELVDWTGRQIREDKRSAIPPHIQPVLQRLGVNPENWVDSVQHYGKRYHSVTGSVDRLQALSEKLSQAWVRGIGASRRLYLPSAAC